MLALLLTLSVAQVPQDEVLRSDHMLRTRRAGGRSGGYQYALFEFAPPTGAGMGTACACSTITGAKGETLTFSRASTATCTKGNPTSGIANGDLVTCASGQPRVGNPDGAGLKLLVEGSRTNSALQSQNLSVAPWVAANGGPGAPTVTANFAVAPDGTTTASRVQIPATSAAQFSGMNHGVSLTAASWSESIYLMGVSGSGVTDLCTQTGVSAYTCSTCSFTSTSWTRCTLTATALPGASYIGNMSSVNGGTARAAVDVLMWGFQAELGAYATSYIPTTTVAVTRAAETATLPITLPLDTSWSAAATVASLPTVTYAAGASPIGLMSGATGKLADYIFGSNYQASGVCSPRANIAVAVGGPRRFANWIGGGQCAAIVDGTSQSGTAGGTGVAIDTVRIGFSTAAAQPDAYVGNVCIDSSSTRCR